MNRIYDIITKEYKVFNRNIAFIDLFIWGSFLALAYLFIKMVSEL